MRCVCGYYHLDDYEIDLEDIVFQEELRNNNGEQEFIQMEEKYHSVDIYYHNSHVYSVYACPKCGTLKINI